jgi:DNA-binding response OmpR family regulator
LNAAAPDVVVLDLGLPDLDGTDVLKMIRSITDVPVIIATARDDEDTIVRALDLGADEYVVKPFSGEQLDARIRAVLRRGRIKAPKVVTIGDLRVDMGAHEATLDGRTLELRRREFELLSYLAERAGDLVSRDEIAREVWNDPLSTTSSTIDVHISALRRQLGETADPRPRTPRWSWKTTGPGSPTIRSRSVVSATRARPASVSTCPADGRGGRWAPRNGALGSRRSPRGVAVSCPIAPIRAQVSAARGQIAAGAGLCGKLRVKC